jgi:hypothetical protein
VNQKKEMELTTHYNNDYDPSTGITQITQTNPQQAELILANPSL